MITWDVNIDKIIYLKFHDIGSLLEEYLLYKHIIKPTKLQNYIQQRKIHELEHFPNLMSLKPN